MNLYNLDSLNKSDNIEGTEIEIRRVQALAGEKTLTLVFPKVFASKLGIMKGDFLKCYVEGCRLMVEKIST